MAKRFGSKQGIIPASKTSKDSCSGKRTSLRLPTEIKRRIPHHLLMEGYNLREKSKWVNDAINAFLNDPSWRDQVLDSEQIGSNNDLDAFTIDASVVTRVDDAVDEVIAHWRNEVLNNVRGGLVSPEEITSAAIIRTAILWKLAGLITPYFDENEG